MISFSFSFSSFDPLLLSVHLIATKQHHLFNDIIELQFRNPIISLGLRRICDGLVELDKGVFLRCVLTDHKKPWRNIAVQGPKNGSDISGRDPS